MGSLDRGKVWRKIVLKILKTSIIYKSTGELCPDDAYQSLLFSIVLDTDIHGDEEGWKRLQQKLVNRSNVKNIQVFLQFCMEYDKIYRSGSTMTAPRVFKKAST